MSDIFFALSKPAWIKGFRKMLNADIGGRPCRGGQVAAVAVA